MRTQMALQSHKLDTKHKVHAKDCRRTLYIQKQLEEIHGKVASKHDSKDVKPSSPKHNDDCPHKDHKSSSKTEHLAALLLSAPCDSSAPHKEEKHSHDSNKDVVAVNSPVVHEMSSKEVGCNSANSCWCDFMGLVMRSLGCVFCLLEMAVFLVLGVWICICVLIVKLYQAPGQVKLTILMVALFITGVMVVKGPNNTPEGGEKEIEIIDTQDTCGDDFFELNEAPAIEMIDDQKIDDYMAWVGHKETYDKQSLSTHS